MTKVKICGLSEIEHALAACAAGADFLVLCTNTMHKTADEIAKQISIPLLHIADATAQRINDSGLTKVGLLGTRFTMEDDFYRGRLVDRHSLLVVVPEENDRQIVHQVIYDELCLGRIESASKEKYAQIMKELVSKGAEASSLSVNWLTATATRVAPATTSRNTCQSAAG